MFSVKYKMLKQVFLGISSQKKIRYTLSSIA